MREDRLGVEFSFALGGRDALFVYCQHKSIVFIMVDAGFSAVWKKASFHELITMLPLSPYPSISISPSKHCCQFKLSVLISSTMTNLLGFGILALKTGKHRHSCETVENVSLEFLNNVVDTNTSSLICSKLCLLRGVKTFSMMPCCFQRSVKPVAQGETRKTVSQREDRLFFHHWS